MDDRQSSTKSRDSKLAGTAFTLSSVKREEPRKPPKRSAVKFNLRERRPGPAYNSPDGTGNPSTFSTSIPLFDASSPEPRPNAYPGFIPVSERQPALLNYDPEQPFVPWLPTSPSRSCHHAKTHLSAPLQRVTSPSQTYTLKQDPVKGSLITPLDLSSGYDILASARLQLALLCTSSPASVASVGSGGLGFGATGIARMVSSYSPTHHASFIPSTSPTETHAVPGSQNCNVTISHDQMLQASKVNPAPLQKEIHYSIKNASIGAQIAAFPFKQQQEQQSSVADWLKMRPCREGSISPALNSEALSVLSMDTEMLNDEKGDGHTCKSSSEIQQILPSDPQGITNHSIGLNIKTQADEHFMQTPISSSVCLPSEYGPGFDSVVSRSGSRHSCMKEHEILLQSTAESEQLNPSTSMYNDRPPTFQSVHNILSSLPLFENNRSISSTGFMGLDRTHSPHFGAMPGSPHFKFPTSLEQVQTQTSATTLDLVSTLNNAPGLTNKPILRSGPALWRVAQLEILHKAMSSGLTLRQAFSIVGMSEEFGGYPDTPHSSLEGDDGGSSIGVFVTSSGSHQECRSMSLQEMSRALPLVLLKALAVRRIMRARFDAILDQWKEAQEKALVVKRECDIAMAYEVGLKLGITKVRLRKFRKLGVTGSSVVVLPPLHRKLVQRLVFMILRHMTALKGDLDMLLYHMEKSTSPVFAHALLYGWREVTVKRLQDSKKVDLLSESRRKLGLRRMMHMWHAYVQYQIQVYSQLQQGQYIRGLRMEHRVLLAWRDQARNYIRRREAVSQLIAKRLQKQLQAWHQVATMLHHRSSQSSLAGEHYRRGMLVSAIAHWRVLHLRSKIQALWKQALHRWHSLRLKGRVLKLWHFSARRSSAIIARATAKNTREAALVLPPPLPLTKGKAAAAQLMKVAEAAAQTTLDEMRHLCRFLRFREVVQLDEGQDLTEVVDDHLLHGPGEGGGNRLLMGQWHLKDKVLEFVQQKLKISEQKTDYDALLVDAITQHNHSSLQMQARLERLQRSCLDHKVQLQVMIQAASNLEHEHIALNQESDALGRQLEDQEKGLTDLTARREILLLDLERAGTAEQDEVESIRRTEELKTELQHEMTEREHKVLTAEAALSAAMAAEKRANEKLAKEQTRLAEALKINNALTQHLKQVQQVHTSMPPYHKPRQYTAVEAAQAGVQEAHRVLALVQVEVAHQNASAQALKTAASAASQSLDLATQHIQTAQAASKEAQQASQNAASNLIAIRQRSEHIGSELKAVAQQMVVIEKEMSSLDAQRQLVVIQLEQNERDQAEIDEVAELIYQELKMADEGCKEAHHLAKIADSELTAKRLATEPHIYRLGILLSQIDSELSIYPPQLVQVIEQQQQQQQQQQQYLVAKSFQGQGDGLHSNLSLPSMHMVPTAALSQLLSSTAALQNKDHVLTHEDYEAVAASTSAEDGSQQVLSMALELRKMARERQQRIEAKRGAYFTRHDRSQSPGKGYGLIRTVSPGKGYGLIRTVSPGKGYGPLRTVSTSAGWEARVRVGGNMMVQPGSSRTKHGCSSNSITSPPRIHAIQQPWILNVDEPWIPSGPNPHHRSLSPRLRPGLDSIDTLSRTQPPRPGQDNNGTRGRGMAVKAAVRLDLILPVGTDFASLGPVEDVAVVKGLAGGMKDGRMGLTTMKGSFLDHGRDNNWVTDILNSETHSTALTEPLKSDMGVTIGRSVSEKHGLLLKGASSSDSRMKGEVSKQDMKKVRNSHALGGTLQHQELPIAVNHPSSSTSSNSITLSLSDLSDYLPLPSSTAQNDFSTYQLAVQHAPQAVQRAPQQVEANDAAGILQSSQLLPSAADFHYRQPLSSEKESAVGRRSSSEASSECTAMRSRSQGLRNYGCTSSNISRAHLNDRAPSVASVFDSWRDNSSEAEVAIHTAKASLQQGALHGRLHAWGVMHDRLHGDGSDNSSTEGAQSGTMSDVDNASRWLRHAAWREGKARRDDASFMQASEAKARRDDASLMQASVSGVGAKECIAKVWSVDTAVQRYRSARVAHRVLMHLAKAALQSRSRDRSSAIRGQRSKIKHAFQSWIDNVRSLFSDVAYFASLGILKDSMARWRGWWRRHLVLSSILEGALKRRHRKMMSRAFITLRQNVKRKAYQRHVIYQMRAARLRSHLHYWRGWVEARSLLFRVFFVAEQCWEEVGDNYYRTEYHYLSKSWSQWKRAVQEERTCRMERVGEEVAMTHWRTVRMVAAFAALQHGVFEAWQERRTRRRVSRLLVLWLEIAQQKKEQGSGLGFIRRHIRMKQRGYQSERELYLRNLMRKTFWRWAGKHMTAVCHAELRILNKAWIGLVAGASRRRLIKAQAASFMRKVELRKLRRCMRSWLRYRLLCENMMNQALFAEAWRNRSLGHAALKGFRIHCERRRELMNSLQAALLFRRRQLLERGLLSLRLPSQSARHHYKLCLKQRMLTRWRLQSSRTGFKASKMPLTSSCKHNQTVMVGVKPQDAPSSFHKALETASSALEIVEVAMPSDSLERHQPRYDHRAFELQLLARSSDLLVQAGKLSIDAFRVASDVAALKSTRSIDSNISSIAISLADLCKNNSDSLKSTVAPPSNIDTEKGKGQPGLVQLTQHTGDIQSSLCNAVAVGDSTVDEDFAILLAHQWHELRLKLRVLRAWEEFCRFDRYPKDASVLKFSVRKNR